MTSEPSRWSFVLAASIVLAVALPALAGPRKNLGRGVARVKGKRYSLAAGSLLLIEHGDQHEIRNTGRALLRTLNIYTPPAYTAQGDELPSARP